MSMLELHEIDSFYGDNHILFDVSMDIEDGELVALIGRNGAGKTTTLRSIMGMVEVKSGEIVFDGEQIQNLEPNEISQRGISLIPEGRGLFPELTVYENLRLGHLGHESGRSEEELLEPVFEYFPRLEERRNQRAGAMSGGERQMLAIGRGLVSDPDFLLVDEPTEGLMPSLVEDLRDILVRINEEGTTVLLVEQNVGLALDISDRAYVLDEGHIEASGVSDELARDEDIKERYLMV